jgi:hypothetical protein
VTVAFYCVPGQAPRATQTFARRDAAVRYARRARLEHPTWAFQIVLHTDGEQTVLIEEGTR